MRQHLRQSGQAPPWGACRIDLNCVSEVIGSIGLAPEPGGRLSGSNTRSASTQRQESHIRRLGIRTTRNVFETGASNRWASFGSTSETLGVAFWNRTVRKRLQTSVETLIGRTATVASTCRAHGQVHLDGEIWEARCAEGADRGETVTVVSRDLLWLVVERLDQRTDRKRPSPLPATARFPPPRFLRRVDRRRRRSAPSRQPALLLAPSQERLCIEA